MGYRCRWIAVRASERADALSQLQLSITHELNEAVHDTGLYAVAIAEWFVVIGDGRDFMDLVERRQAERRDRYRDKPPSHRCSFRICSSTSPSFRISSP